VTSIPNLSVSSTALALIGGTVVAALGVGLVLGVHGSLLVFLSGGLLGAILLVWHSLRTLDGDADVEPGFEPAADALHGHASLVDRKRQALRALKDIEQEHAVGKIDDADFARLDAEYRDRAKDVIREIDATLEPYRDKAEALVRAHLEKRAHKKPTLNAPAPEQANDDTHVCASCETANDSDAAFCKKCGAKLPSAA